MDHLATWPAAGQSMRGVRPASAPSAGRAAERYAAAASVDAVGELLAPDAGQDDMFEGQPDQDGLHEFLTLQRRRREFITPKLGTAGRRNLRSNTQLVHEDTAARAREIQERMDLDDIGPILAWNSGSPEPLVRTDQTVAAPSGETRECAAGRFRSRARDAGMRYEIEVELIGGRLLSATKNALRSTVTFSGDFDRRTGDAASMEPKRNVERLTIRVPRAFDLTVPPAFIARDFAVGRCQLGFHRRVKGLLGQAVSCEEEL